MDLGKLRRSGPMKKYAKDSCMIPLLTLCNRYRHECRTDGTWLQQLRGRSLLWLGQLHDLFKLAIVCKVKGTGYTMLLELRSACDLDDGLCIELTFLVALL
jgi:hypothetical protein